MGLNGKSVLMFCPEFFGYREQIVNQMGLEGCFVDCYDERPASDFLTKALLRMNSPLIRSRVKKYYAGIITKNRDKHYDYVFVIKGEAVDSEIIGMLRNVYSDAVFVLYLWDSVRNVPGGQRKLGLYDRVLTFDPDDARKYDIPFRPLFYGSGFERAQDEDTYAYDICFVGTAHSVRPRIVKEIERSCAQNGLRFYSYLYLPHVLVYVYNRLTNRDYRRVSRGDIHFEPLPRHEVQDIYRSSRCILDIEHPGQQGITSRPLEMLKMQKKIITTNQKIADYDFYCEDNFLIIDPDHPSLDTEKLNREYVPVSRELLDKYSVKGFLDSVLY